MPLSMPTYQISYPVQFSPRSAHSIKHTTAGLESTIQPRPKYGNLSEGARRSGSGAQATRKVCSRSPATCVVLFPGAAQASNTSQPRLWPQGMRWHA